jgi:hypothetical protein
MADRTLLFWRAAVTDFLPADGQGAIMSDVRRWPGHVDGYFVVRNPLFPSAQGLLGRFLDDGLLVIVPGEGPDCVQAREVRDGGEHGLLAVVLAQEAGAAESTDRPQVATDLR